MTQARHSKETFNSVATLYDQARPSYPRPVLEQIERYARLTQASKIVEVGPGTGQASGYFIDRGYALLGVELGADLVTYTKQKFAQCSNAQFVTSSFEDWNGASSPFDLLLAAQSFHWINPTYGVHRASELLKSDGSVSLLWNLDESSQTEFWMRATALHEKYLPTGTESAGPNLRQSSQIYTETLQHSPLFTDTTIVEHRWERTYSSDEWIKMRNTFSPDLRLDPTLRNEFHAQLRAIIEELGGSFTRYYKCYCILSRRR